MILWEKNEKKEYSNLMSIWLSLIGWSCMEPKLIYVESKKSVRYTSRMYNNSWNNVKTKHVRVGSCMGPPTNPTFKHLYGNLIHTSHWRQLKVPCILRLSEWWGRWYSYMYYTHWSKNPCHISLLYAPSFSQGWALT